MIPIRAVVPAVLALFAAAHPLAAGAAPPGASPGPAPPPAAAPLPSPPGSAAVTTSAGTPPGRDGGRATAVVDNVTGTTYLFVKGGCFRMGDPSVRAEEDEQPSHEACVSDFWLAATEVTQADWEKVMGWVPSYFKEDRRNPVEGISWDDTQAYIARLEELAGRKFRLPTEAEWEYAARGGEKGAKEAPVTVDLDRVAWYEESSDGETHPVGEMDPNALGLYDMLGNVWEWCSDWFDPNGYRRAAKKDPKGPATGTERVLRGGSWADPALNIRVTERGALAPSDRSATHGFRLVLVP